MGVLLEENYGMMVGEIVIKGGRGYRNLVVGRWKTIEVGFLISVLLSYYILIIAAKNENFIVQVNTTFFFYHLFSLLA